MKYLGQALLALYEGSATLKAVLQDMYFINKPASARRPFALITPIAGTHGYSSQNRIEWIPVTFVIEGRTQESVMDAAEALYRVYDNATLQYAVAFCEHISIRRLGFSGPDEDSGVWTYSVDYGIQRARGLHV